MKRRTPEQVGKLLREQRQNLGLTQGDLSHVSAATARKIEAGRPVSRASLVGYLKAMRLPLDVYDRLLGGEDLTPQTGSDDSDPIGPGRVDSSGSGVVSLEQLHLDMENLFAAVQDVAALVQAQWDDLRRPPPPPTRRAGGGTG